ncbi:unnamed protein product, partial [Ectocarpus sp. 12 AP-2014]
TTSCVNGKLTASTRARRLFAVGLESKMEVYVFFLFSIPGMFFLPTVHSLPPSLMVSPLGSEFVLKSASVRAVSSFCRNMPRLQDGILCRFCVRSCIIRRRVILVVQL